MHGLWKRPPLCGFRIPWGPGTSSIILNPLPVHIRLNLLPPSHNIVVLVLRSLQIQGSLQDITSSSATEALGDVQFCVSVRTLSTKVTLILKAYNLRLNQSCEEPRRL